jgi:hypothetical protein
MGRQRIKVKGVQNKYNEDHRINFVRKSKTALNCTSIENKQPRQTFRASLVHRVP